MPTTEDGKPQVNHLAEAAEMLTPAVANRIIRDAERAGLDERLDTLTQVVSALVRAVQAIGTHAEELAHPRLFAVGEADGTITEADAAEIRQAVVGKETPQCSGGRKCVLAAHDDEIHIDANGEPWTS